MVERLEELIKSLKGRHVTLQYLVPENGTFTIDGVLEEVTEEYLKLRKGNTIRILNRRAAVIFEIVVS